MPMPEATSHIDDGVRTRNNDIRPSKESLVANTESPPCRVDAPPHKYFGLRITPAYATHYLAALLWRYPVHVWGCRIYDFAICDLRLLWLSVECWIYDLRFFDLRLLVG